MVNQNFYIRIQLYKINLYFQQKKLFVFKTFLIQKYIFFLKQQKLNLNKEIYMKKY